MNIPVLICRYACVYPSFLGKRRWHHQLTQGVGRGISIDAARHDCANLDTGTRPLHKSIQASEYACSIACEQ